MEVAWLSKTGTGRKQTMGYVWKKPLQAEVDWSGLLEGESFSSNLRNVGGATVTDMVCRKDSSTQRRLA